MLLLLLLVGLLALEGLGLRCCLGCLLLLLLLLLLLVPAGLRHHVSGVCVHTMLATIRSCETHHLTQSTRWQAQVQNRKESPQGAIPRALS